MNGVDLLLAIVGLALLFIVVTYLDWKQDDHYRRVERLVRRNLYRQMGQ